MGQIKSYNKGCAGHYRYGFNGKEKDIDGEFGSTTTYDYGFRIYNPSIGKFLSVDPLTKDYASWTPYAFAMNRVIDGIDIDGLEWKKSTQIEIDLFMGVMNEGEVGYVYKTPHGNYFTYVGDYKNSQEYGDAANARNVFDSKILPIPNNDIPYRKLNSAGKVDFMFHSETGPNALAPWMVNAWFYYNEQLSEIKGKENHPWIMEMHKAATNGWIPPNDDNEGPWCSSFACYVMDNSFLDHEQLESPKNAYSLSWRNWGEEVSEPVYGSVAVKSRTGGGHVGFVVGQSADGTKVAILGGNQNNEVNISLYDKSVFDFYLPDNYDAPEFSEDLPVYTDKKTNPTEQ